MFACCMCVVFLYRHTHTHTCELCLYYLRALKRSYMNAHVNIPFPVCEEGEAKAEGFGNGTMVTMATHRSEWSESSTCVLS